MQHFIALLCYTQGLSNIGGAGHYDDTEGVSMGARKRVSVSNVKKSHKRYKGSKAKDIKIHEPSADNDELKYTKAFSKLQSEWYKKLAESKCDDYPDGFEDIEYVGHSRQDASVAPLKTSSSPNQTLGNLGLNYHYYNLLTNFLTHNTKWSTFRDREICKLYVAGISYRKIIKHNRIVTLLEAERIKSFSVFIVFQAVRKLVRDAMLWNKENPEGLEYKEVLDAAEDAEGGEA